MKIVLASNNEHKLKEFREAFSKYTVEVYSLKDIGISIDVDETGTTFKENAFLKAEAISRLTDYVVVADDSGLEIKSLNGFPGIRSARFMEGHPYKEKFVAINKMLDGYEDRTANFNCTICVMNLTSEPVYFEGKTFGVILNNPRGEEGFGYDPIFYYEPLKKTFAELTMDEKNMVSHRGNAIKMLLDYLLKESLISLKKLKYKNVLFDLDGTLLNTIDDITICINEALKEVNVESKYTNDDCKKFIGSGVNVLIEKATAPYSLTQEQINRVYSKYMEIYAIHRNDHTRPFIGAIELIKRLKDLGIKIGVISNKPDRDTKACVKQFFQDEFDFVIGAMDDVPHKPNPKVFEIISKKYDLNPDDTLYVGDMIYDLIFAENIGTDCAICRFGFGQYQNILGAKYYINNLNDLLLLLEE